MLARIRTVVVVEAPRVISATRGIFGAAMPCGCTTFEKQTAERLDYEIDWSAWLASDTITASTWAVDPDDATLDVGTGAYVPTNTPYKTKIWLLNGTVGVTYTVTNTITTTNGRITALCFKIVVEDCDGC